MNLKNTWLLLVWIILIISASCARQGTPTGGPKDTIPPTLVRMDPALGTVNFDEDEIELEFSEFIEARELKKELIINPSVKEYKFFASKRTLVIQLEESLKDSTTYTFNFREGVKDISEGNSAQNITLAFSTGNFIDSFQVVGNVKRLMNNKPAEDVVVGLYPTGDTITIMNGPPMYFTKTNEEGNYNINYIREGSYKIYAFDDKNNNLLFESNNEAIGFVADTIHLKSEEVEKIPAAVLDSLQSDTTTTEQPSIELYGEQINLVLVKKDLRPITIQSSRANGQYYEIKFNKPLKSYSVTVEPEDLSETTQQYIRDSLQANVVDSVTQYIYSNFQEQQQLIRFYNTIRQDSLRIFLSVEDSVNQQIEDTVLYISFTPTRRKPDDLTQQFKPEQEEITRRVQGDITFSKPMVTVKTDSILLAYDTLFTLPIEYNQFIRWNSHYDKATITKEINREELISQIMVEQRSADSMAFIRRQSMEATYIDSLQKASTLDDKMQYFEVLVSLQNDPAKRKVADSLRKIEDENTKKNILDNFSDSVTITEKFTPPSISRESILSNLKPLVLYMAPGSFMSIEQDSSQVIRQTFPFKNPDNYGTIKGEVKTDYPSYIIQLTDQELNVIAESRNQNNYSFQLIPPGNYLIRILIDQDEDGQWEEGNLLKNEEPEPVVFFEGGEIPLKANWVYTQDLAF